MIQSLVPRLIEVSDENWRQLNALTGPSDSLDDIVGKLLVETGNKTELPEREPAKYRAATVVRLLEDAPFTDNLNKGSLTTVEGHVTEDYKLIHRDKETGKFARLPIEPVEQFEADEGMDKEGIIEWGYEQAKEAGIFD